MRPFRNRNPEPAVFPAEHIAGFAVGGAAEHAGRVPVPAAQNMIKELVRIYQVLLIGRVQAVAPLG
jgi:hypothetical protein